MRKLSTDSRCRGALYGMYIGDALAMPVHWYYNRQALQQDYGNVCDYLSPKNPHPDSELWKHHYEITGPKNNILHDQAQFWGRRGVHYHQFLKSGENTLNLKLCDLLLRSLIQLGAYHPEDYLQRLINFMTTPGNHRDTYIDEYLRGFFKNYANGLPPEECGIPEKHLSGLFGAVPIVIFYLQEPSRAFAAALKHVSLTHKGPLMEAAAGLFIKTLLQLFSGADIKKAVTDLKQEEGSMFLNHSFLEWLDQSDEAVVDNRLGSGCFVDQSFPVVFYLLLKYHQQPEQGLIANTNLGGNNAARGAVLGALLGAANGFEAFPKRWVEGLRHSAHEIDAFLSYCLS